LLHLETLACFFRTNTKNWQYMKLLSKEKYVYVLWSLMILGQWSCKDITDTQVICYNDSMLKASNHGLYYQEKPFNGLIYGLYTSGDTMFRETYMQGKWNGSVKKWYDGGQLSDELNYIDGRPEGLQLGWWPSGKRKYEVRYIKGLLNGVSQWWYPSQLFQKFNNFKNGREEGLQTEWAIDGRPHANYEVKDGKIISQSGTRNCIYVQ